MMNVGVNQIYNWLHNHTPDQTAGFISKYANNEINSLGLLDMVLEVKEKYSEEIAAGRTFSVVFSKHFDPNSKQNRLPPKPDFRKRTHNFSKAIFKFVVEGFPVATKGEAKRKLSICESNDCGYFDGSICRHQNCGCFSKVKTFFETENCPIGKW